MNYLNIPKRYLYLIYLVLFINSKKIVFPFKELEFENITLLKEDSNLFYNQIYLNNMYTKIKIGNSEQLMISTFSSSNTNLKIKDIPKLYNIEGYNVYNYSKSNSFKNITSENEDLISKGYSIIDETLHLYQKEDYQSIKEIKNFQFELLNAFDYNNKNKTLSAEIGLKQENTKLSFINQLLNKELIDSNIITINYISENEGNIYIGENPEEKENEAKIPINTNNIDNGSPFQMEIDYAYIKYNKGRTFYSDRKLLFNLEQGIIIASDGFEESIKEVFFDDKISKGICSENTIILNLDEYNIIKCSNTVNFEDFPTLNFEIGDFTFTFDHNDLFQKVDDIYYFLIIFSHDVENWVIGKPFFKKYQLTFDSNKKTVIAFNTKDGDNNGKKSKLWIAFLVIFIFMIVFVVLIFIYIKKIRKKNWTNEQIASMEKLMSDV